MVKNPPANARDTEDVDLILGLGRFPGGGSGNPLPYSCLESLVDRGPWWATARGVPKNGTRQGLNTNIAAECLMVPRVTRI